MNTEASGYPFTLLMQQRRSPFAGLSFQQPFLRTQVVEGSAHCSRGKIELRAEFALRRDEIILFVGTIQDLFL